MLDIDRFRDLNAAFGAQGGDAAIAALATAFSPLLREGEICSRLSGDEFAVFMPSGALDRALELAESMRVAAEELYLEFRRGMGAVPERASITVSVGAASSPEHAGGPEELVTAADKALYMAKEGGRNRVELFATPLRS
jgi:diguanylate cyclase (GGDEF)-like protein